MRITSTQTNIKQWSNDYGLPTKDSRGFTPIVKMRVALRAFFGRRQPFAGIKTHFPTPSHRIKKTTRISTTGFTMIETLIAITILLTSIAGPMTIASKGISSAVFARDQIAAFYLAQEAVEFIRNRRDENILKGNGWLDTLGPCMNSTPCTIDAPNDKRQNCSGGVCPVLQYDDSSGFYNHETGDPSKFTRSVELESVDTDEYAIQVTVSWQTGTLNRSFTIQENIFNWQ